MGRPRRRPPSPPEGPSFSDQLLWAGAFLATASALVWVLWPIFSILLAAAALAYLLDPIADRFERAGYKRQFGIGFIFTTGALGCALFVFIMLPVMAGQFIELSDNVRVYMDNIANMVQPAAAFIEANTGQAIPVNLEGLKAEIPAWLSQLSPDARSGIKDFASQFFASSLGLFTAFINLALLPIFTFYLLSEWDKIVGFVAELIPHRHRSQVGRLAAEVDERLAAFVRGQITVCCVLAIAYSLGLWLADIDLAFTVGILAGALFVVPYLGTAVGLVLASTLSLMKFGVDVHLLYVGLAFGIPQFIESWYLTPKIVGDKVGLHPLVVMIALLAGGSMAGVWGMLLAIPLTAVGDVLAREGLRIYRQSVAFTGGLR